MRSSHFPAKNQDKTKPILLTNVLFILFKFSELLNIFLRCDTNVVIGFLQMFKKCRGGAAAPSTSQPPLDTPLNVTNNTYFYNKFLIILYICKLYLLNMVLMKQYDA